MHRPFCFDSTDQIGIASFEANLESACLPHWNISHELHEAAFGSLFKYAVSPPFFEKPVNKKATGKDLGKIARNGVKCILACQRGLQDCLLNKSSSDAL